MNIIQSIVNKCHVADSNRKVIQTVISKFINKYEDWIKLDKENRKEIMKLCILYHSKNRSLYYKVSFGKF